MNVTTLNGFESPRLIMTKMQVSDFALINELLNTEGFIKYIGDRNIRSDEDAKAYIEKTLENRNIHYWIVSLINENIPVGMVSLVKRDFLPIPDIGYSFLPQFLNRGFALEATYNLMRKLFVYCNMDELLAIPNKDNERSVHLLEKLCFTYQKEIEHEGKVIQVYSISKDDFTRQINLLESRLRLDS